MIRTIGIYVGAVLLMSVAPARAQEAHRARVRSK